MLIIINPNIIRKNWNNWFKYLYTLMTSNLYKKYYTVTVEFFKELENII
jgi:hypothetical protein